MMDGMGERGGQDGQDGQDGLGEGDGWRWRLKGIP
jgi:hypothetical protein